MERIVALESEHWRTQLQMEEADTAEELTLLSNRTADLERRLAIHHQALNTAVRKPAATGDSYDTSEN
jgi:hypothetical protein